MAKIEQFKCDLCDHEAFISVTFNDRRFPTQDPRSTDLCDKHFSLLRSYIRHEMPSFKNQVEDDGR